MEPEELLPHFGAEVGDFEILAYTSPERRDEVTVIDADEFDEAWRDPKTQAFLQEARDYYEKMEREGRNL